MLDVLKVDLDIGSYCHREYRAETFVQRLLKQLESENNSNKGFERDLIDRITQDSMKFEHILNGMDMDWCMYFYQIVGPDYICNNDQLRNVFGKRLSILAQNNLHQATKLLATATKCQVPTNGKLVSGLKLVMQQLIHGYHEKGKKEIEIDDNVSHIESNVDFVKRFEICDEWKDDSQRLEKLVSGDHRMNLFDYSNIVQIIEKQEERLNNLAWYNSIGKIHERIVENEVCL